MNKQYFFLSLCFLLNIAPAKSAQQNSRQQSSNSLVLGVGAVALVGGALWYLWNKREVDPHVKIRALMPQEQFQLSSSGCKDLLVLAKENVLKNNQQSAESFLMLANTEGAFDDTAFVGKLATYLERNKNSNELPGLLDTYFQQIVDGSFAKPENSYTCGVGQFQIDDAKTACAAMGLMSMVELKSAKSLDALRKKDNGRMDTLLAKGKSVYDDAKKDKNYLSVDDLLESKSFPKDSLQKIDLYSVPAYFDSNVQESQALKPFDNALTFIEQYGASLVDHNQENCAAAAALPEPERDSKTLYGLFTVEPETIMIAHYPDTKKWMLFDSHRSNKYSAPGSGFHEFTDKQSLTSYLVGYPLTISSKPVECNLFS